MEIKLNDIKLFGYHGLNDNEKEMGQHFIVSINLMTDIDINLIGDNINNTIDYTSIYQIVKKEFNMKRYNLLETLVHKIKTAILNSPVLMSNNYTIIDFSNIINR